MAPPTHPRRTSSPTVVTLASLAAGLVLGVAAAQYGGVLRTIVDVLEPLGALWVNAIRMTLVPLVVALVVTSVTGFADVRALGRLGARAVLLFLLLLAGTAVVAALAAPPLLAHTPLDPATAAALRALMAVAAMIEPDASGAPA